MMFFRRRLKRRFRLAINWMANFQGAAVILTMMVILSLALIAGYFQLRAATATILCMVLIAVGLFATLVSDSHGRRFVIHRGLMTEDEMKVYQQGRTSLRKWPDDWYEEDADSTSASGSTNRSNGRRLNLDWRDNVVQLKMGGIVCGIGSIAGFVLLKQARWIGAGCGAVLGFIMGVFLGGVVLLINEYWYMDYEYNSISRSGKKELGRSPPTKDKAKS